MANKSSRLDGYNRGFTAQSGNSAEFMELDTGDVAYATFNGLGGGVGTNEPYVKLYPSPTTFSPVFSVLPSAPPTGLAACAYGLVNGQPMWVALTNSVTITSGALMTSPDGKTWTARTLPSAPGAAWVSVTFGNGVFVAVAATTSTTAGIATSYDGINWTFRTTAAPAGNWNFVAFGGPLGAGIFVATSASTAASSIFTSPDGVTWTAQTTPTPAGNWSGAAWGNPLGTSTGMWVFTALGTTTNTTVYTSIPTAGTLAAFVAVTLPTAPLTTGPVAVAFHPNANLSQTQGVSAVQTGAIATGAAGGVLTLVTPNNNITPGMIVSGAGVTAGTTVVSGSGTSYVVTPSQTAASTSLTFTSPEGRSYYTGLFVIVCSSVAITAGVMFTFNGTAAASILPPTRAPGSAWLALAYGQGVMYALNGSTAVNNAIASSMDGVNWTMLTLPSAPGGAWKNLAVGDQRSGLLVLVANVAQAATSTATSIVGPALLLEHSNAATAEGFPDLFIVQNQAGFIPDVTRSI